MRVQSSECFSGWCDFLFRASLKIVSHLEVFAYIGSRHCHSATVTDITLEHLPELNISKLPKTCGAKAIATEAALDISDKLVKGVMTIYFGNIIDTSMTHVTCLESKIRFIIKIV